MLTVFAHKTLKDQFPASGESYPTSNAEDTHRKLLLLWVENLKWPTVLGT